jgi:hypothetical protein
VFHYKTPASLILKTGICYFAQAQSTQLQAVQVQAVQVQVSPSQSGHWQSLQPQAARADCLLANEQHDLAPAARDPASHLQSPQAQSSQLQLIPSQFGHLQSVQPHADFAAELNEA